MTAWGDDAGDMMRKALEAARDALIDGNFSFQDEESARKHLCAMQLLDRALNTSPEPAPTVQEAAVERVAEAMWFQGYGRHRKKQRWPDDVIGGSQELFRDMARAALRALSQQEEGGA